MFVFWLSGTEEAGITDKTMLFIPFIKKQQLLNKGYSKFFLWQPSGMLSFLFFYHTFITFISNILKTSTASYYVNEMFLVQRHFEAKVNLYRKTWIWNVLQCFLQWSASYTAVRALELITWVQKGRFSIFIK